MRRCHARVDTFWREIQGDQAQEQSEQILQETGDEATRSLHSWHIDRNTPLLVDRVNRTLAQAETMRKDHDKRDR